MTEAPLTQPCYRPRVVGWELTLRCNLRCLHCGQSAGAPREEELTLEEGLTLVDHLVDLGARVVTLTGGEPLLHPHWDRYAKKLVDAGVDTGILTNGLLLEQNVERLLAAGMKRLSISLDGTEPTHDRIRNHPGAFSAAMRGARSAREAGLAVGAVTSVSPANIEELEDIYRIVRDHGMPSWLVQVVFSLGRLREHPELRLDPRAIPRIVRLIHEKQQLDGPRVRPGDDVGYFCEPEVRRYPWKGCFAGRLMLGIGADGSVKGCLGLPEQFVEGNIRREPLRRIWEDPERFAYNRAFSVDMLGGDCRECPHGEDCRAGCSCMAFASTGNRFDNPYCAYRVQRVGESGA